MEINEFKIIYIAIYGFFAFISIFICLEIDFKRKPNRILSYIFSLIFVFTFIYLFSTRDVSVGTDTKMYMWQFLNYKRLPIDIDFLFSYLLIFINILTPDYRVFFVVMSLLYLLPLLKATQIFSKVTDSSMLMIIFTFVSLFFFQTLGINIIRQACGLAFFLLGIAYFFQEKKFSFKIVIPFFIATGLHFTSIIPILLFLLVVLIKKIHLNFYYFFYIFCLLLSAVNFGVLNFSSFLGFLMVDERRSNYLTKELDSQYVVGFKPQFVVFNSIFLILFIFINKKIAVHEYYNYLLKYFLIMSGVFFLMFQIPFSDRWGVMSWIIIPFLLSPVFKVGNKPRLAFAMSFLLISIFIFFNNY